MQSQVPEGVNAVLEAVLGEVLEDEMPEYLDAGYRELTPTRHGERNVHFDSETPSLLWKIERLEVPRGREDEFVAEAFERYKRMTGDVEEPVLQKYLSGIFTHKVVGLTAASNQVRVGKDAVS